MASKLVFDVSTLVRRATVRPTGIDRVLLESAVIMADLSSDAIEFCAYERPGDRYVRVDAGDVVALAARMRGDALSHVSNGDALSHLSNGIDAPSPSLAQRITRALPAEALNRFPSTIRHACQAGGHLRRAIRESGSVARAVRFDVQNSRRARQAPNSECLSDGWTPETIYCSVGMDFSFNDLNYLADRRSQIGFKTALAVYDILPVVTPQYVTMDLKHYFAKVVDTADHIFVISKATASDLGNFIREMGLEEPPIHPLPLGSSLKELTPARPQGIAPELSGNFVVTVGTVTIRKNHHLLLDVWEMMLSELGRDNTPRLVIAGLPGPLSSETMSRIERTREFEGVVFHLPRATDEEIAWLYTNCCFTVYPSLYEGWGLPVSESLDFGKVCLTTDRTSLPEAGNGLATLLPPFDRMAWKNEITRLWANKNSLMEQERQILRDHSRTTASDMVQAILKVRELQPLTAAGPTGTSLPET
jgi:glycosyltransferase involved in cell wall biosynthesis